MEKKWSYGEIKANMGDTQAPHHPHGMGHSGGGRAELGISTTFSCYSGAISSVLMEFDQNASNKCWQMSHWSCRAQTLGGMI